MKTVLLQMEDEAYEMLMKKIQKIADAEEFCLDSAELHNIAYLFLALVEKAKPFDDLTNGEVFMQMCGISQDDITYVDALVPYALIKSDKLWSVEPMVIPLDWWNRKWGE